MVAGVGLVLSYAKPYAKSYASYASHAVGKGTEALRRCTQASDRLHGVDTSFNSLLFIGSVDAVSYIYA